MRKAHPSLLRTHTLTSERNQRLKNKAQQQNQAFTTQQPMPPCTQVRRIRAEISYQWLVTLIKLIV